MGERDAPSPRVDIVVVGWNRDDLTRRCFQSIQKNTPSGAYRLIYVDNGSAPAPTEHLLHDFPAVTSVRLPHNTGFPHGANVGLALSLIGHAEYVLLLNNDAEIPEGDNDWLERWLCHLQDPTVGAVGAVSDRVAGYQRRNERTFVDERTFINERTFVTSPRPLADLPLTNLVRSSTPVPALIFFAVMLRMPALREVGLLDERFTPGNYEDYDYSIRLARAGWQMRVAEDVWIEHVMHASHVGLDLADLLETNKRKLIDKWGAEAARQLGLITNEVRSFTPSGEIT